ncbi:hypothetical protein JZ786_22755 [Alicyclobacillus mengziensis]|uniref:Uncharacterized protein n=2 Tax=Alicyclobacillus mengziensis TaxID=2931921 RepID=A0A9X7VYK9_9BACL|nr:hypothetical protein JZ786_22755 [Alicyclobacillus mengziensis]
MAYEVNNCSEQCRARRPRAYMSEFGTTTLHLKNPWVVTFWSFAFPGCGNLMQGRLVKGLVLICWELLVNNQSNVNLAIMYSLLGRFDMTKQVVNTRWLLLYVSLYVYAMWDSFRGTVDLNKQYLLADREDGPMRPVVIKTLDTNFLDKQMPALAACLSLLMPGLGHLYVHKVMTGLFFISWTILVIYLSHALQAVQYTMIGAFDMARSVVDMQWLMFLPSIYGFVLHDAYVSAVEQGKLFQKVQSRLLREWYQHRRFKMPM